MLFRLVRDGVYTHFSVKVSGPRSTARPGDEESFLAFKWPRLLLSPFIREAKLAPSSSHTLTEVLRLEEGLLEGDAGD